MTEHKIKDQSKPRYIKGSIGVTLTCTCGRQFTGSSRMTNSKFQTEELVQQRALENAEAEFRKHIPIR